MTAITSPLLNPHEIDQAARYLDSTRDALVEAVGGLSDARWHFQPAPDSWSIAGILEHLALLEERIPAIIGQLENAPPTDPNQVASQVEEVILRDVPKRSSKLQAPPQLSPAQRWPPAEALARFLASRTRTVELLTEAPFLRGCVLPHPILGPWEGYQWILAGAAHTARHTGQILEIKAHPGFPVH